MRCDESVKRLWLRLRKRIGSKRAIVAVARRMLRWMWSADRHGVDYGVPAADDALRGIMCEKAGDGDDQGLARLPTGGVFEGQLMH